MKPSREQLEAIFEAAAALQTDVQRQEYLDRACPDSDLRREVESLLAAMKHPESLFDTQDETSTVKLDSLPVLEQPGTMIGRYKLLQKVGVGGMGVVYMAEQTEPVKRKVALKIIKLGMDTKQVVARFEAERQALAMMDHPNIAKVLDAGATDTGRPYFVMELVRGVPITEYCDKNKLSTKERLELFLPVCQAIQHAHQKGVIHRDIKPSNVMVTLNEGIAHPMVIDFGIAKATNQNLTEKTLFTHYAQMIGTPAYMAPEQAEMSKLDIDTRTDVYSLGVLLYELLTGTTPFPVKELMSMGYGEMQRIIAEQEPPKPSTRLSTMLNEERSMVAKNRSMEVSAVGRAFQGDLDWIVMKALEKDRTHRYETVNGFASDIRRHLNDELVTAAAPTFGYQLRKFARRNKQHTRAVIGIAAALMLGIGVALVALIQKQKTDREMIESKQRELNQSVRADTMTVFIDTLLGKIVPTLQQQGNTRGARDLLEIADQVASVSFSNAPAAEIRLRQGLIRNYGSDLRDPSATLLQAERIEQLLSAVTSDQLFAPLDWHRVIIAAQRMWAAKDDVQATQQAMARIDHLYDEFMQRETPATIFAMQCRAVQGTWYLVNREWQKAEPAFADAYALMPRNWGSRRFEEEWKYKLPAFYVHSLAMQQKFEIAEEILKANAGISSDDSQVARDSYMELIYAWCNALCRQDEFAEAVEMVSTQRQLMMRAGAKESELVELDTVSGLVFARSGQPEKALSIYESVIASRHSTVENWRNAMVLAVFCRDQEVCQRLRRIGVNRFLTSVQDKAAHFVASTLLLEPGDDLPLWLVQPVVKRVETAEDWAIVVASLDQALLALREKRFDDSVGYLQQFRIETRNLRNAFLAPEGIAMHRFIGALVYAHCDRLDLAQDRFKEAMEWLEKASTQRPGGDIGHEWSNYYAAAIYRREAETVFKAKGIPVPVRTGEQQ